VLSRTAGQKDPVFGTVLFGRMQGMEGAERVMGLFINTLPVRIRLAELSARESVTQAHRLLAELMAYEGTSLASAQRQSSVAAPLPLFTSLLNYRHSVVEEHGTSGAFDGIRFFGGQERTNYPVMLCVDDMERGFSLKMQSVPPMDPLQLCAFMHRALESLVEALDEFPDEQVRRLEVLPAMERQQLLVEWNATQTPYPQEKCVHELFEEQARSHPGAIALTGGSEQVSYGELNRLANQLAQYLRARGVGPEEPVAVCLDRSVALVVALLGTMKVGGVYVPLDSTHPRQRLEYVLKNSRARVVLTVQDLYRTLPEAAAHRTTIVLDAPETAAQIAQESGDDIPRESVGLSPCNLAYIIYTSGSTGVPKGVGNTINGLVNRLTWFVRSVSIERPVTAFKTSVGFVDSVTEMLQTLLAGGRLVAFDRHAVLETDQFVRRMQQESITMLVLVPSMLTSLLASHSTLPPSLKLVVCSGERLPAQPIREMRARYPQVRLFNLYGSSEVNGEATSLDCAECGYSGDDEQSVIGRPIANTRVYILDTQLNLAPVGVVGEVCVAGSSLARGYVHQAGMTAQHFIANPFTSGTRLYRTGDLGRYRPDGSIEYLGRTDAQVKLRGYRIELGEVEAQLHQHARVREAVVLVREDEPGEERLVAYYTSAGAAGSHDGEAATEPAGVGAHSAASTPITVDELRAYLSTRLPEYMIPAAYVALNRIPRTPNGKLDRKSLPRPGTDAYSRRGYEEPVGEVEQALSRIWSEVLKVDRIGRYDNFFDLGGHSLLAIRVLERMRRAGLQADVRTLFSVPVLADLAVQVRIADVIAPPIERVDRSRPLVLSFAQQRLWFLSQLEELRDAYHIPLGLRFQGKLDEHALKAALDHLVARHEALRTTFYMQDGEPFQRVHALPSAFALRSEDWRPLTEAGDAREQQLKQRMREEFTAPFSLENGPLIRGCLIRLAEEDCVLLITMHHIVSDGWSLSVFMRELSTLYRAYVYSGGANTLEELPIQYADYAAWQRQWLSEEVLSRQGEYWKRALAGAPSLLELPTDRARPAQQDLRGMDIPVILDEDLTLGLKDLSRRHGLTLFMTVLAGWALVLSRLSNQKDVVIGAPSANRDRQETEGLIGFFVNTLALRLRLSRGMTLLELLHQARAVMLEAQAHADLPFERVVELLKPARSLNHTPIFQVMLAWQGFEASSSDFPGLQVRGQWAGNQTPARFDLTLSLGEYSGRITGSLNYATALFDESSARRFVHYLRAGLRQMVENAEQKASCVDLLSTEERQRLLVEWNATYAAYPGERCIHELFEEQVERTPTAVAVEYEDQALVYAELNARANQLARYLRARGVGPDVLVGICVERSLEMVVGLLAVLKAGGAYVPLDPSYPTDRLSYLLADATPKVLLTQQRLLGKLADAEVEVVALDADWDAIAQYPTENLSRPSLNLTSGHLAYVIYTSGSTGRPKGVMVEHKALVNLALAKRDAFDFDSHTRTLANNAFGFDVGSFEIVVPLCWGARVRLPNRDWRVADPAMANGLRGMTHLFPTPGFLSTLDSNDLRNIRVVSAGGQALTWDVVRDWPVGRKVFNAYGPTETTVTASLYRCESGDAARTGRSPPIGRPIANVQMYLLDEMGHPCPEGVVGEICIGGAGVARGYWRRPGLTAEKFVASPFISGVRLYRTGDLGRYRPDGNIEFVGRNDEQVKVRGYRVELGEIESRLHEHPGVREAAVLAREDRPGDQRLVAYYTSRASTGELPAEELRAHLSARLPAYMVPAAYVYLDKMPLSPNGKVDRKALPAPEGAAFSRRNYEAPVGEIEQGLCQLWAEALNVQPIGRHDNFFDLGGHSLLAIRVVAQANERGIPLTIRQLFERQAPSRIAETLAGAAGPGKPYSLHNGNDPSQAIFLILPIFHGRQAYETLVGKLGDCPVVLLDNPELDELNILPYDRLVEYYAKLILTLAPEGPLALGGWSRGGTVAAAVAAHFERQGRGPRGLVLIDPFTKALRFRPGVTMEDVHRDPLTRGLTARQQWELAKELSLLRYGEYMQGLRVQAKCLFFKSSIIPSSYRTPLQAMLEKYLELPAAAADDINGFDAILKSADIVPVHADHSHLVVGEAAERIAAHIRRAYREWRGALACP
jgi:amino acid adenylation domain-containing protein